MTTPTIRFNAALRASKGRAILQLHEAASKKLPSRGQVAVRQGKAWQVARNAWTLLASVLESAVEYGYLQMNPAGGVKFPLKAVKQKPAIIAGDDFVKLLGKLREPYRTMVNLIAATCESASCSRFAGARST